MHSREDIRDFCPEGSLYLTKYTFWHLKISTQAGLKKMCVSDRYIAAVKGDDNKTRKIRSRPENSKPQFAFATRLD